MATLGTSDRPREGTSRADLLTTLSPYVGGQLEIQNNERGLFIGEIAKIELSGGAVVVSFAWLAKANTAEKSQTWHAVENVPWRGTVTNYTFNDFGQGRACMSCTTETVLFQAKSPKGLAREEVLS